MEFMLNNVQAVFPKVFKGDEEQYKGKGDPFWSASFILGKDHPQLQALSDVIRQAAVEKWKDKADTNLANAKAKDKLPVHSGDLKADKTYGEAYRGKLYVSARRNARTNAAPGVFDKYADPATGLARALTAADGKIYSGCFVNVKLGIYAYSNEGEGIAADVMGIQWESEGTRLTGGGTAKADDFQAIKTDEAPMPTAGAPAPTGAASLF